MNRKGLRLILKEKFNEHLGEKAYEDFFEFKKDLEKFLDEFKRFVGKQYGIEIEVGYHFGLNYENSRETIVLTIYFSYERDTDGIIIHPNFKESRISIPSI